MAKTLLGPMPRLWVVLLSTRIPVRGKQIRTLVLFFFPGDTCLPGETVRTEVLEVVSVN